MSFEKKNERKAIWKNNFFLLGKLVTWWNTWILREEKTAGMKEKVLHYVNCRKLICVFNVINSAVLDTDKSLG